MSFYILKKLVRDKFIENCKKNDINQIITKKLSNKNYISSLKKKLIEESKEVIEAKETEDIKEEICDVFEVLDSIMRFYKINKKDIFKIQKEKRITKGSFEKGVFCEKLFVDESQNCYWSSYLRKKYKKEIKNEK